MNQQELKNYFGPNGQAGLDKKSRPDIFKARVAEVVSNEELARELIKSSGIFAQSVVEQFGKSRYRALMDREDKSPLLLRAEESLRAQGRQPGGRGPIERPIKVDQSQSDSDSGDIAASDTLCSIAGLPLGSSFNQCFAALKAQDQKS